MEVRALLSEYYSPDMPADVLAAKLADWADELQDWTVQQVLWARRKWVRENPDRRPNVGHILQIMKAERGRQKANERRAAERANTPEAPRERITPDRAAEILREHGFGQLVAFEPKAMPDCNFDETKTQRGN